MTRTDSGLAQEEIAASVFRAYMNALGAENPDWERAGERDEKLFMHLALIGGPVLQGMEGRSHAEVADVLQRKVNEMLGFPPKSWEEFGREHQVAMEAVARHICFLIDSEDEARDMNEMERHWKEWAQKRLARSTRNGI